MQNNDWNIMKLAWDAKQALVSHPKKDQTKPYQSSLY